MDEPFSARQSFGREPAIVVDLWRGSQHAGLKSIFLVTHNMEAVFMARVS
jgi:ABC-type taurine transport system ATPase subunit